MLDAPRPMGTWVAAILETEGRADFWEVARRHGVEPLTQAVPPHVLIDCSADYQTSFRLAEALSRELDTMAMGFAVQTSADVHEAHVFHRGECVRRVGYNRDDGGWTLVEGKSQPWERVYFFDDASTTADDQWPDMLFDDLSDDDVARYEEAKRTGDPASVMDLLHPSSMAPMRRVCGYFEIDPDSPAARWKKPSLWSRLFGN